MDANITRSTKTTFSYTDFQAASTTKTLTVYTPQGQEVVLCVLMVITQAFAGSGISTMTVNLKYGANAVIGDTNALVTGINPTSGLSGVSINPVTNITGTSIIISTDAVTTGADLNALTQGSIDFYVFLSEIPV